VPIALGCFSLLCGLCAIVGAAVVAWFGFRSPTLSGPMVLAAGALLLGAAFFGLLSGIGGAVAARRSGGGAASGAGYAGAAASFLGLLGAAALVALVLLGRLPSAPPFEPLPPTTAEATPSPEASPEAASEPTPLAEEPTAEPEAPPSTVAPAAPRRPAPKPSRPPVTTEPERPAATPEPEPTPEPTRRPATGPVRVGGNVPEPRKVHSVAPEYPPIARKARVQGIVILEATIGPRGNVTDVKVLRSIPLLDQAAIDAVKQWVYEPTLVNGVPTGVIMTVTVNFKMN
jgi:protein TonB